MTVKVNGQVIPEEAIQFELSRLITFYSEHIPEEQIRAQLPTLRKRAVDQAIGAKLLIEEAVRLDIQVTDDEVDESVEALKKQFGGEEGFQKAIQSQNTSESELRASMRRGKRVDKLVERITEGISDPTEEEMQAHFEGHKSEYTKPRQARAQHILVKPAGKSDDDKSAAQEKILAIRERLEKGADFGKEAEAHSECPSGKQAGGSLGWFSPGMMVKAFDDVVFSLSIGDLSDVVETDFGYHLIQKTGEGEEAEADYMEVREKVRDFLRHSARGESISAHVNELREKAEIEMTEDGESEKSAEK